MDDGKIMDAAVPATERIAGLDGPKKEAKKNMDATTKPKAAKTTKPKAAKTTKPKDAKTKFKSVKVEKKFTPKGKAKADPRRVGGKWPGAIGVCLEPKLFARLEKGRVVLAKREKVEKISRSKAISRALDAWLQKVGV